MSLSHKNIKTPQKRKNQRYVLFVAIVIILISAAVFIASNSSNHEVSIIEPEVGQNGPIRLIFPDIMNQESVEERITINPNVELNYRWHEMQLEIWPDEPVCEGCTYQLVLKSGSQTVSGKIIKKDFSWAVDVRDTEIVYLSFKSGSRELWRSSITGEVIQLTDTGGQVVDFDVSPDGESLVYSVVNAQNGSDLWVIDRDGENQQIVFDCQSNRCQMPDWSADGTRIAFAEKGRAGEEIGILRLQEDGSWSQANEHIIIGTEPSWSSDGKWLAYYATAANRIEIIDVKDFQLAFTLPSRMGQRGSWINGQEKMVYQYMEDALFAEVELYQADFLNQEISQVEISGLEKGFLSRPVIHPSGDWMVLGYHNYTGTYSKQLWKVSLIDQQSEAITTAHNYSHVAFSWDPDGRRLLYQRLSLDSSQAEPEIWIWVPEENSFERIVTSSGYAAWLP